MASVNEPLRSLERREQIRCSALEACEKVLDSTKFGIQLFWQGMSWCRLSNSGNRSDELRNGNAQKRRELRDLVDLNTRMRLAPLREGVLRQPCFVRDLLSRHPPFRQQGSKPLR